MSQANFQAYREPIFAAWIGYVGLIPFLTLAFAIWLLPQAFFLQLHQALLSYAAIILSFMGAIHWGLAMAAKEFVGRLQFAISVIPALIAWFASLTSPTWNYSILLITFVCLCIFDNYMVKILRAPRWYPVLCIPLTSVAAVSLIIAQLSL